MSNRKLVQLDKLAEAKRRNSENLERVNGRGCCGDLERLQRRPRVLYIYIIPLYIIPVLSFPEERERDTVNPSDNPGV